MRVNYRIRAAINQYFAHRVRCSNATFATAEIKERCLQALHEETRKAGISLAVIPGVIILTKGNRFTHVRGPVWMDDAEV